MNPVEDNGPEKQRCFIYGAGNSGELLLRHLLSKRESPFQVVGFIDDDANKIGRSIHGVKVFGSGEKLEEIAAKKNISVILIAMTEIPGKLLRQIVDRCRAVDLKPLIVPELTNSLEENAFKPRKIDVSDLLKRDPVQTDKKFLKEFFHGKSVLITGAGGSIGSEISRQVLAAGAAKLILLEMSEYNLYQIYEELKGNADQGAKLHALMGSVSDERFLLDVFSKFKPQIVFHAAAYKHVPLVEANVVQGILNNVLGTKVIAEISKAYHVERFLLISSDKAVNPPGVMGQTKRVCELIVQSINHSCENRTKFCAVRFGNVLGSSGSVVPKFMEQIATGGPVTVTDPKMNRYFMLTTEAVQLVLQSITMTQGGEVFVLNMGEPVNIYEMAQQLIHLAGKRLKVDIDIVFTGIRDGEKMFEELMYDGFEVKTSHHDILITKSKARDYHTIENVTRKLFDFCSRSDDKNAQEMLKKICFQEGPLETPVTSKLTQTKVTNNMTI